MVVASLTTDMHLYIYMYIHTHTQSLYTYYKYNNKKIVKILILLKYLIKVINIKLHYVMYPVGMC